MSNLSHNPSTQESKSSTSNMYENKGEKLPFFSKGHHAIPFDRGVLNKSETPFFQPKRSASVPVVQTKISDNNVKGALIQRKVRVGGKVVKKSIWSRVSSSPIMKALNAKEQQKAQAILNRWIRAKGAAKGKIGPLIRSLQSNLVSEDREYATVAELASSLVGEIRSAANLEKENKLSQQVQVDPTVLKRVDSFMKRLQNWHNSYAPILEKEARKKSERYSIYYSGLINVVLGTGNIQNALITKMPSDLNNRIALASDYSSFLRKLNKVGKLDEKLDWELLLAEDHSKARPANKNNKWNPNESSQWVKEARFHSAPLSAGPSATTAQLMTLCVEIGASAQEKEAMAWGIFSFFNQGLNLNHTGTHRFHEVMDVAKQYGVAYEKWIMPESIQLMKDKEE